MSGKGTKRGFTAAGRHGAKKQKLTSLAKELISHTKQVKARSKFEKDLSTSRSAKKQGKREGRARIQYNRHQQILTIGEGNFSFTKALVQHFHKQAEAGETNKGTSSKAKSTANDDDMEDIDNDGPKNNNKHASNAKMKYRREGQFDPTVHSPFLPPDTPFTNPECRVIATCYDSFKDLMFKYPDASAHLTALRGYSIPIFTGVDALHLERAKRVEVTQEMIDSARAEEKRNRVERDRQRASRKAAEADEEDYAHAAEEDSDSDEQNEPPSLLFPPFITRRTLHGITASVENKLHGSQRKKWRAKREKDQQEFAAAVSELTEAAKPSDKNPNQSKRPPSSASIKMKERAAHVDSQLQQINSTPRTRFHRIIFNFPHTGCGIKDTEKNNQHHREFLESFFRNVVTNRLVYPADQHGEIHVTLKKGEPYKSWNIIQIAKRVTGLKFKTSVEFYPFLYPGYEHRRTRGFDEEKEVDLSSGAIINANQDITGGAMTYVFTRERTVMDEEEQKFDAEWIAKYAVEHEAESVRQQLLDECARIYRETKAAHGELMAAPSSTSKADNGNDSVDESADDGDAAPDASDEEEEEDDEEKDDEQDAPADTSPTVVDDDAMSDTEESTPVVPSLAPNFAAAFKQHFQVRPPSSQQTLFKAQPKGNLGKAASASLKSKLSGHKRK